MGESRFNGKTGEWLRFIGGIVFAGIVGYFTAQNATNERLVKIETRWESVVSSLARIENRMDERDREERQRFSDWLNGVNRQTLEPLPLQKAIEP